MQRSDLLGFKTQFNVGDNPLSYYYSPFQLDNAVNTDEVDEIID